MAEDKNYTLIVGMGKTGDAIAKFLNAKGENIIITDMNSSKEEDFYEKKGIKTEIGFHNSETFEKASLIIVSPGVPLTLKELAKARKLGIPITGELDTISELINIPIIAITGTNGKTTVTSLIGDMLKKSGLNVFVCGNIGTPIVNYLSHNEKADLIVAEISSFQLDTAKKFKPKIAVLLNITEDHLDRYDSFSDYAASKWSLFKNQTEDQFAIINAKIDDVNKETAKIKSKILYYNKDNKVNDNHKNILSEDNFLKFDNSIIDLKDTKLKGQHNRENIEAAILATISAKGNIEGIRMALKNFVPLPHRIEFVNSINGVEFYNDSKATNPDSVKRAIKNFDQNIILIMGGKEKNTDFSCLKQSLKTKTKLLIVMGQAKDKIANTFSDVCKILHVVSMEDAVKLAYQNSSKGDVVLLSPGCTSFDMYQSYSQRGFDFVEQVERLKK